MFNCCKKSTHNNFPDGDTINRSSGQPYNNPLAASGGKGKKKGINTESKIYDLLILGPSECGKSTVCRQLVYISLGGVPEAEIPMLRQDIIRNILTGMKELIAAMNNYQVNFATAECANAVERIRMLNKDVAELTPQMVNDIKRIFNDEGARKVLRKRNEYGLQETFLYFVGKIDEIAAPYYIPTWKDAVHVRRRTTEILTYSFIYRGCNFRLTDVGGERTARLAWMECFDAAMVVIYVASLADYDMPLREAPTVNRLVEAIRLFSTVARDRTLSRKDIVLFLNKKDVFMKKLETKGIDTLFPEYTGPQDFVQSAQFIRNKFLQASGREDTSSIRSFVTMATDNTGIQKVFDTLQDKLIHVMANTMLF